MNKNDLIDFAKQSNKITDVCYKLLKSKFPTSLFHSIDFSDNNILIYYDIVGAWGYQDSGHFIISFDEFLEFYNKEDNK